MATKCARMLLVLVGLATVSTGVMGVGVNKNPGVMPPQAKHKGKTYAQWEAIWWQTLFSIPIVDGAHPQFNGGAFGGRDGVVFLTGVVGAPAAINITIPPGTALFFPLVNVECSVVEGDPFHGDNEVELRQCANFHIDNASDLFATVDGVPINNLSAYRSESPLFEFGPLPDDNVVFVPGGTTSPAVSAGYYLLLRPLSVGQHTLHIGATIVVAQFGTFMIDTNYVVTVTP